MPSKRSKMQLRIVPGKSIAAVKFKTDLKTLQNAISERIFRPPGSIVRYFAVVC